MRRASLRSALAAIAAGLCLLLIGCASTPPPLSDGDRTLLRSRILDRLWGAVAGQYPEAIRPSLGETRVLPDPDWSGAMQRCLEGLGFSTVEGASGELGYGGSNGATPIEFAVAYYGCAGRNVMLSDVTSLLTSRQYASLRAYYLTSVRPCLLAAGAASPAPPGRAAFVAGDTEQRTWNPFEDVWARRSLSRYSVSYLETRCPPVPGWLELGDG